ncbi:MAG: DUF861 domain-containing protein [Anaerolineales bacterium]|nr:DUF861 domain-containing protein [Anaerolineales bacterium]
MSEVFFPDLKSKAVFSPAGPQPQFLLDTPQYKALVVGLEAGQQLPPHPAEASVFHFLEGEGQMTVDGETFAFAAGSTVVMPAGAKRGVQAKTRVIFFVTKGGS